MKKPAVLAAAALLSGHVFAADLCGTVGKVVTVDSKEKLTQVTAACGKSNSSVQGWTWGTDAGATNGSAQGSCKMVMSKSSEPKTACYCVITRNPGPTSAVGEGDWVCWMGV